MRTVAIRIEWAGDVTPGLVLAGFSKTIDERSAQFLLQAAEIVRAAIVEQIASWVGKGRSRPTGQLMGSWKVDAVSTKESVFTTGVFSDIVYARIHNEGGTIRPRSGQFLTVPLIDMPIGTTARSMSDLVFAQSKRGSKFLVRPVLRHAALSAPRRSKGMGNRPPRPVLKTDELIWFLAPEVRIRAKRYLESASAAADPLIAAMAEDFWSGALA